MSQREETSLLEACGSNALLKAVVTLALNTALRKNETRTLRWSQIDFKKRIVTVGRAKTHASSGRVIPLNQPAFDSLAKWAGRLVESKSEDYVFPACEAAGIEREHPDRERIDPFRPIKSYSHIRMEAKRAALDAIAKPVSEAAVAQNWAQLPKEEKPPVRNCGPGWT